MDHHVKLWAHTICALLLLAAPVVKAQDQPTFRDSVEVSVISIDVFVEDRDGNRVHGLTADDFILLEDREPQPITNFSEYRGGADTTADQPLSGPDVSSSLDAVPSPPRTVILFVDPFHQDPEDRKELFTQMHAFLRTALDPGDRAALLVWRNGRVKELVPLTGDLDLVERGLASISGLQLPEPGAGLDAARDFFEEAEDFEAGIEALSESEFDDLSVEEEMEFVMRSCAEQRMSEMRSKTASLQRIIGSLAGVEGRKTFVYLSGRFPADTQLYCRGSERNPQLGPSSGSYSTDRLVNDVTSAANAAGVTFYPIRPSMLSSRSFIEHRHAANEMGGSNSPLLGGQMQKFTDADALATLAERTGGRIAVGNWMVDDIIQDMIADLDDYYSLGYRSTSDGSDRTRRITVRMKNPRLRARTRESFVEKSRLSHVKDQLLANLVAEPDRGEIELEVIELEPQDGRRERTFLPLEIRIPLDQLIYSGNPPMSVVRLLTAGGQGTPGDASEIIEEQKKIEKPPADMPDPYITWEVRVKLGRDGGKAAFAVLDEISGLAGFATIDRTTETLERLRQEELAAMSEWQRELVRAHESDKPILVYFRPERCVKRVGFRTTPICEPFEGDVLAHPEIERRMDQLELIRWEPDGQIAEWPDWKPGMVLMRVDGQPVVRWEELPDGANMARILDAITPHASEIVRINQLVRNKQPGEADLATAMLQIRLGLRSEAASILEQLETSAATVSVRELAAVRRAFLDALERSQKAMERLRELTAEATEPVAQAEAWLAIAALSEDPEKEEALTHALETAPPGSSQWNIARNEISAGSTVVEQGPVIRIAPVKIASGRTEIRTVVRTTDVASVEFVLDGRVISTDDSAPFRAALDLERVPERHELRVTARASDGAPIGEDRMVLNGRKEAFWVRIVSPEQRTVGGNTRVQLAVRVPENRELREVTLALGEHIFRLDGPPWSIDVEIEPDTITVLEARAILDDGTVAADTRILNMDASSETAGVHLVELPIIASGSLRLTASDLVVFEDGMRREIQALLGADTVPLTFGLVIDTSSSMADRILDVQSASAALVEQLMESSTHGFLISFASEAQLQVDMTDDASALVSGIRGLSPGGATSLYDAIMLGLLQFEPLGGRRALIVFSDGDDSSSRYKIGDVAEVAKRASVPIYLVRARAEISRRKSGPPSFLGSPAIRSGRVGVNYHQQARLQRLTVETGGGFFQLDSLDQVDDVFAEISGLASRQMILTYLTDTGADDEWRPVEVELKGQGEIRTPKGYFARPGP